MDYEGGRRIRGAVILEREKSGPGDKTGRAVLNKRKRREKRFK